MPSLLRSKVRKSAIASVVTGATKFSVARLLPLVTTSSKILFLLTSLRNTKNASSFPVTQPTVSDLPSAFKSNETLVLSLVSFKLFPSVSMITGSSAVTGIDRLSDALDSTLDLALVSPKESTANAVTSNTVLVLT